MTTRGLPIVERFMLHVVQTENCWLWTASLRKGYGQFGITIDGARRMVYAHRFAYERFIGAIPKDLCVLHHCDNPKCVNPGHLFLGTMADNDADRDSKGRQAKGERHGTRTHPEQILRGERQGMAKLTRDQVLEIKRRIRCGIPQRLIAASFKVHPSNIGQIATGRTWSTV